MAGTRVDPRVQPQSAHCAAYCEVRHRHGSGDANRSVARSTSSRLRLPRTLVKLIRRTSASRNPGGRTSRDDHALRRILRRDLRIRRNALVQYGSNRRRNVKSDTCRYRVMDIQ